MSKTIDADAYSVYAYSTGAELDGLPTEELVIESLSVYTGAVQATYDSQDALWHYLRDDEADAAMRRGEHVRTVYVMQESDNECGA